MPTILLVDDNPAFLAEAVRLCEAEGFTTVSAGNLAELHAVLETAAPDLVFLDVELPEIPGHRLGPLIRSRRDVPIVLLSALDEAHVRRLFESSDADGWICKPLTAGKLRAAAGRFLAKAPAPSSALGVRWLHATEESDRYRVLVVEDEAPIAARIEAALSETCEVTTVGEGNTAIDHLLHGRYECVLLDLMLPRLSGFDVLRHLMLRRPEILKSTIIMTAATDESLQFIDPSRVAGVLHKPFPADMLAGLVARVARSVE